MTMQILNNGETFLAHRNKINANFAEIEANRLPGIIDYNDLATGTTPISIPGTGAYTNLTNDGLGPFTNRAYAPPGVTDVYDTVNNRFDWNQLSLGDMVTIRLDIEINILSVNTEVSIALFLAEGTVDEYPIQFGYPVNFKNTGTYRTTLAVPIYMGNTITKNGFGKFKFKADKASTVRVHGWFCQIFS